MELADELDRFIPPWATAESPQNRVATLLRQLAQENEELRRAKWDVKHIDTMNDMAAMGMARDAAEQRVKVLEGVLDNPTPAMIDAGVSFALCVSLGGDYRWSEYVRDLFKNMARAALAGSEEVGG